MSETSAGAIIGTLRLSITDFEDGIAKAMALADALDGKNVNVNVNVNTAGAATKLAAVATSANAVGKSSAGASGGLSSVESAARKLADASAVANIAQLRLSEAQKSGTASASSLASAHQSVTKAQRDLSAVMASSTPQVISAANAMKQVDDSNTKVAKSSKDAGNGLGLMSMAIVGLGPAIVPIAAGAAGLAVGFGALGVAGVAALIGIKQEMALGDPVGFAYTNMLNTLGNNLQTLGQTAALGVLGPFQTEVANLQTQMPALNSMVGDFSVIAGKTAGNLVNGLIAAFITFEPLAREVGVYVLDLSQRFASMMSGPGVVTFGDYIRSVFPQVMATVEDVVTAAVRLVVALAPMGGGVLTALQAFSAVITAIPVNVLTVLATGAASVFIGFKAFSLLSTGITAVGTALEIVGASAGKVATVGPALRAIGVSADAAAAGMDAMNIAAGVIGVVVTVAMLALTMFSGSNQQATQSTNDLTDALIRSKGVIDQTIISDKAAALAKDGTLAAAKLLGISYGTMTGAALGLAGPLATVNAALAKTGFEGGHATNSTGPLADAYDKVSAATKNGATNLNVATLAYKAYTAATATSSTTAVSAAQSADRSANAQQMIAGAAAVAAQKMADENDAAGLLKASLDLLNGKALSAADAQNSFDSSLVNMGTHVDQTGRQITFTTTSINDMSSASVALRGQLDGQVTNLQNVIEANGGFSGSTGAARAQMVTMRQEIIHNAVAHGVNRDAVTAYIDKLLTIPKTIPPTALDVATTAAGKKVDDLQALINNIKQGNVPGLDANSVAGKAKIADLQAKIDAIKQKLATVLDANNVPGKATVTSLQTEIDNIKQHRQPGLDANTAAGKAKIADLQAQILALTGKNIPIDVSFNTATNSFINKPPTWGPLKAAGGPISGPGTGTSDQVPILASNGEHMLTASDVNAAGGHAGVMAWRNSLHGMATGGPINIGMPSAASLTSAINSAYPPIPAGGFTFNPAALGSGGGGGGAAQWSSMVAMVLAMLGQPASDLAGNLRRINLESGGNPNAINLTDSNAAAGHPSQGLMQTIPGTFAAYAGAFASRGITDPFANIYAGDAYAIADYGSVAAIDPLVHPGGYANGTNGAAPGWGWVGENGKELMHFLGGETVVPNHMLGAVSGGPGYAAGTLGATDTAIGLQFNTGMAGGASSATIAASIAAVTALTASWKASIAAADAATARAKLVSDAATAAAAVTAAWKTKNTTTIDSANSTYTTAAQALTAFDTAAQVAAEDAKIAVDQAALATANQLASNRELWAFNHESAQQQLADLNTQMAAVTQYSAAWMTLAQQRETLQSQIDAAAQTALDASMTKLTALESAQNTYTSAVAAANATLAQQTQQLEDARTVALSTWAQLSTATGVGFAPSMSTLLANGKEQISQFSTWMGQLALARSNGVSEAVISSLGLDQGPQALAQLQQINKGTVAQVTQLNADVAQKTTDANAEMVRERTNMLSTLGQALMTAQQAAATSIAAALDTFNATLATAGMTQAQTYTAAIAAGMLSGIPAIMAAAAAVQAAMTGVASAGPIPTPTPGAGNVFYQAPSLPGSPANSTTSAMLPPQSTPYPHGVLVFTDPSRLYLGQIQTADTAANRAGIAAEGGTIVGGFAGGGWVGGVGTGTSDSNLMFGSKGEFVVNAAQSAANASLLTAINSGQQISMDRPVSVNVAAPTVHVYVDGQEFRGLVRVELANSDQAKAMTARRMVNA